MEIEVGIITKKLVLMKLVLAKLVLVETGSGEWGSVSCLVLLLLLASFSLEATPLRVKEE